MVLPNEGEVVHSKTSCASTLFAWVAVALAILSGSAIGPVFKYMEHRHIPPCLSASWRCQTMIIFLIPLAILEHYLTDASLRVKWFSKNEHMPLWPATHMLISGLAWTGNLLCWIEGLEYTTTVRASVFANVHPLMLVVVLRLTGGRVSYLEWTGVVIVIVGIVISSFREEFQRYDLEKQSHKSDDESGSTLFGDFLCLIAAASEMIVLFDRIKTKHVVPLMQYTATTTLVVTVISTVLSISFEYGPGKLKPVEVFCTGPYCVFGWLNSNWVIPMLLFGLFVGVVCMSGYNYSVQFISPLIFSALTLLEPAVTGLISWAVQIEGIPDTATILGSLVVLGGVGMISAGESKREEGHEGAGEGLGSDDHAYTTLSVMHDDHSSGADLDMSSHGSEVSGGLNGRGRERGRVGQDLDMDIIDFEAEDGLHNHQQQLLLRQAQSQSQSYRLINPLKAAWHWLSGEPRRGSVDRYLVVQLNDMSSHSLETSSSVLSVP